MASTSVAFAWFTKDKRALLKLNYLTNLLEKPLKYKIPLLCLKTAKGSFWKNLNFKFKDYMLVVQKLFCKNIQMYIRYLWLSSESFVIYLLLKMFWSRMTEESLGIVLKFSTIYFQLVFKKHSVLRFPKHHQPMQNAFDA